MVARGPYYADLDNWVAQLVGGSTQYGNGTGEYITIGPAPNAVSGDPDFKSRGLFRIPSADIAAFLADATIVDDATVTVTVAPNTCIGSRGSTIRLLLEEMTAVFTEKSASGNCGLSSGTGTNVWNQSNNATTTNRAFHSSGSHSTGDDLTFDVTDMLEARRAAEDTSDLYFRIIAANADGTGYAEETAARRISVYSTEWATQAQHARLSGNVTTGDVPKAMSETGAGADDLSVQQQGTEPALADVGVGVDGFTAGPAAGWSTGYDENDNGRAFLYVPTAGLTSYAYLPDVSEAEIELRCKVKLDKMPLNGGAQFMLLARYTYSPRTYYRARMTMGGTLHDINIYVEKVVNGTLTILQYITNIRAFLAGEEYWLKMQVSGTSPATIRAKTWRDGDAEPGWVLQTQDSEADLQDAGAVGMGGFVTSTVTNVPITFTIDQFEGYAP